MHTNEINFGFCPVLPLLKKLVAVSSPNMICLPTVKPKMLVLKAKELFWPDIFPEKAFVPRGALAPMENGQVQVNMPTYVVRDREIMKMVVINYLSIYVCLSELVLGSEFCGTFIYYGLEVGYACPSE